MHLHQFFITLSGDDYKVINELSPKVKFKFAAIGAFVFCVFLLCLVSSYFSYAQLFQDYVIGIPIAIFIAYMFTNIYLLFLYTLNKNSFPEYNGNSEKSRLKKAVNYASKNVSMLLSLVLRIIFIAFIAIIISKPIELLVFSLPIKEKISEFKKVVISKNKASIDSFSYKKSNEYRLEILKIVNLNAKEDTMYYANQIIKIENERLLAYKSIEDVVSKSNFYVQSIVILMRDYPASWFLSLITITIFLLPAFIKNLMSEQNEYYSKKIKMDRELVENDYFKFRHSYNVSMFKNFGQDYLWKEHFEDAPFNTIRKKDKRYFRKESDLLTEIYGSPTFVFEEIEDNSL